MSNQQPVVGVGPSVVRMTANRSPNLLPRVLAALAGLALLGAIIGIAMHNGPQAPAASPVVDGVVDVASGINPTVGLPIDGNGALTEAVAAPVIIDIYSDFSCPFCANFEATYADQLMELARDPNVSLRWHPVSVLDHEGGTGFSTRAGAIFLETAVRAPQHLWAMNDLLLHNQQQAAGMPSEDLISALNNEFPGLELPAMETILANRGELLNQFTATFRQSGAQGVPFILINGEQWTPGGQPWPNVSLTEAARAAQG